VSAEVASEVRFLERIQRLLVEGDCSATYKFAVLIGLAELAVESWTPASGYRDTFTTRELARHVLALYWGQVRKMARTSEPLRQNAGNQARIVTDLADLAEDIGRVPVETLERIHPEDYEKQLRRIEWKLVEMPLPRLQRLDSASDEFLYTISWTVDDVVPRGGRVKRDFDAYQRGRASTFDNVIRMKPHVVPNLARFHGLVRQLVEARWVLEVRKLNRDVFHDEDLQEHLFGHRRIDLGRVAQPLREMQSGRCFYCSERVGNVHVDHFLPWALYANDRLENLVAAHAACNGSKSDHLPSIPHVERWLARFDGPHVRPALLSTAASLQWPTDAGATLAVARHLYARHPAEARLWHAANDFRDWDRGQVQETLNRIATGQ
jgi:5-methylcytosine-specific restriction endonuclease McrA